MDITIQKRILMASDALKQLAKNLEIIGKEMEEAAEQMRKLSDCGIEAILEERQMAWYLQPRNAYKTKMNEGEKQK